MMRYVDLVRIMNDNLQNFSSAFEPRNSIMNLPQSVRHDKLIDLTMLEERHGANSTHVSRYNVLS